MIASEQLYSKYLKCTCVCIDTRKLVKDCLFIALKGERFDANTFAHEALAQGAKYVLVDDAKYANNENIFLVKNTLETLQELANYHRNQLTIPIVAITGSNGKTTTKELIASVLELKFKVFATPGNFNNHIGLPLSLLAIQKDFHQIAVIEMGANHLNEIDFLCKIAQPTHGLVTNNGLDHLEGYGSLENVIISNTELFRYLQSNNGFIFLNTLDGDLLANAGNKNIISYPKQGNFVECAIDGNQDCIAVIANGNPSCQTQLAGNYNLTNIASAYTVGLHFGIPIAETSKAISQYVPSNNRSQWIQKDKNKILLDAYNANPSSVEAALFSFSQLKEAKKIILLGAMKELGDYSASEHKRISQIAFDLKFDKIVLVGNEFIHTLPQSDRVFYFESYIETSEWLENQAFEKCIFLVKGSRGMTMEKLLPFIP